MKFRTWVNIITIVLLALVIYFSWGEIVQAFILLGKVNLWVLILMVPVQILSYYGVGQIIFSYLHDKGFLKGISHWQMARMAIELNFVNHILPSGGAAGFSYLTWLLTRYKVKASSSVMAQVVRFAVTFTSFVMLVLVAVVYLWITHLINNSILIFSAALAIMLILVIFLTIVVVGNKKRLRKFARFITRFVNKIVRFATRGKRPALLKIEKTQKFFDDINQDYVNIRKDKSILKKPFLWATFSNVLDVSLIMITFLSLGHFVNPAIIFIGFGIASTISIFFLTPGGMGAYETAMITFLVSAGVAADVAIAGTLLARVILLLITIVFGYFFYHQRLRSNDSKK